ncbi:SPOCS domain-containing protein [Desulfotomaculum sp. 1211_IL3151]|uniref:SPOCS domain-containing protein n=1 Tax=Desulfotomaculum sp. 1211_IL3151 TaxID=3084055 RepID=UPI002FD8B8E1
MSQSADVVYQGCTQVVCEAISHVKPPMSKIVGENFDAKVTHYITFCDKILVKGTIERTVLYLHPHHHKENQCCNQKGHNKNDCHDECKNNSINCKKFSCKQVDCYGGIVHFFENIYEFTAVVNVPGIRAGDICKFNVFDVKIKDVSDFFALDCDKNGLVTKGKEFFLLDIRIKCKGKGKCHK